MGRRDGDWDLEMKKRGKQSRHCLQSSVREKRTHVIFNYYRGRGNRKGVAGGIGVVDFSAAGKDELIFYTSNRDLKTT